MDPLDLTIAPPRSPKIMLDGLAMLARTIDKMRASLPGGSLGDYHVDGMSERMMKIVGVDAQELQAVVARASSEDEIVAWMRAHADPSKYAEATHVMLNRSVADIEPERLPAFANKYPRYAEVPGGKLSDIVDADDAATFPSVAKNR